MSAEGFGRRRLSLAESLARTISAGGPISLANYMLQVNSHYYGTRDPLGADGDFTTAPEISQMFGELIGAALADMWMRSGKSGAPAYVELGPGRGTLAADALRTLEQARIAPAVHFVETSLALRGEQTKRVPFAQFHDDIDTLPKDKPLLIVANEFFDALPIAQAVMTDKGWRDMMVGLGEEGKFQPVAGNRSVTPRVPKAVRKAEVGAIHEVSEAGAAIMLVLARRIARQGGMLIAIDYGYEGPALGDTLQAVHRHTYADAFADAGENDLTAHVDFTMLANAARHEDLAIFGPVTQCEFLKRLGINERAAVLAGASPARTQEIETARRRLVNPDQMGTLFKVLAVTHPAWPEPAGFA